MTVLVFQGLLEYSWENLALLLNPIEWRNTNISLKVFFKIRSYYKKVIRMSHLSVFSFGHLVREQFVKQFMCSELASLIMCNNSSIYEFGD